MQAELTNTASAYRAFANGGIPAKTLVPQLRRAEQTLRRLEFRIVALPAPPPATHLRVLLIRLTGSEVATAHEVGTLAAFAPLYAALLRQAKAAGVDLSQALAARNRRKRTRLAARKNRCRRRRQRLPRPLLSPPRSSRRRRRLRREDRPRATRPAEARSTARDESRLSNPAADARGITDCRLCACARASEGASLSRCRLRRRFTLAALAGSVSAQKAQIAAIKAYNRRVRRIGALQGAIQLELARLQQRTG